MTLYDISRTVSTTTHPWPGDQPYVVQNKLALKAGDSVNLTTMTLSPHIGTHADAYYHYKKRAAHPAAMELDAYFGPAMVVTVPRRDGPLYPSDFTHINLSAIQCLLVHSHVSELPDHEWPSEFPYLSVELITWFASLSGRLIGLDSPSVDAFDSTDLPCHHALHRHNMVNLELLCLHGVPDGKYELIALPLKLDAACASPVRAVLRPLNSESLS